MKQIKFKKKGQETTPTPQNNQYLGAMPKRLLETILKFQLIFSHSRGR